MRVLLIRGQLQGAERHFVPAAGSHRELVIIAVGLGGGQGGLIPSLVVERPLVVIPLERDGGTIRAARQGAGLHSTGDGGGGGRGHITVGGGITSDRCEIPFQQRPRGRGRCDR